MSPLSNSADLQRFLSKFVKSDDGCWLWTSTLNTNGYGQIRVQGTMSAAHRLSYQHFVGPVPEGLELDHLCRVRNCINPAHLEPVTHAENVRRGNSGANSRSKTHCPYGHLYEGDNLAFRTNGRHRRCRECERRKALAAYHRNKGPVGPTMAERDRCKNGHPFVDGSYKFRASTGGARRCLICEREYARRYRAMKSVGALATEARSSSEILEAALRQFDGGGA